MSDASEPNLNEMMFIRPRNCHYCGNGFYAMAHVIDYARSKHINVTDLAESYAEKQMVYFTLGQKNPQSIFGFGHGSPTRYTGDSEQDIFNMDNTEWTDDRIVSLLSCQTAGQLGKAMVVDGAEAYAGYIEDWTWACEGGTEIDPYTDKYGKCFFESANQLWIHLIDGYTFGESVQACKDKYDEWISYWFQSSDPNAPTIIAYLASDRDALMLYGDPNAKLGVRTICDQYENEGQQVCENYGCYWWPNGQCRPVMPPVGTCIMNTTEETCALAGCVWLPEGYCHHSAELDIEPVLMNTAVTVGLLVVASAIIYTIFQEKKQKKVK
jgi:hypothetical protein